MGFYVHIHGLIKILIIFRIARGRLDPEKLVFCSKNQAYWFKSGHFDKKCYENEALWKEFQKNGKKPLFSMSSV